MIWSFIAGMFCGALILILLVLMNDRGFVDLLLGRTFGASASNKRGRQRNLEQQSQRRMAAASDS